MSATPTPAPGDGITTVTATALVTEGGSPVDGAVVHFSLQVQGGVPGAPTFAAWDGADPGTPTTVDATSSSGKAVATLKAPRQGFGSLLLSASFSSQGKEPSANFTVPLSPSGGAASALSFVCEHQNIGALVQGRNTTLHMLCRATAFDASNHNITNASVQTLSEAGTLDWQKDDTGVAIFLYSARPDDKPPKGSLDGMEPCGADSTSGCKEVQTCPTSCNANPFGTACSGEPCWEEANGVTHFPRAGIVTLVAAVPGVKGFDNQGEPFLDKNDNGIRDADEPYIDYNGNGKYDGPDGTLKDHMVWKEFRVIWTGEAAFTANGTSGTTHDSSIAAEGNSGVVLNLFDRNLNAVAADAIASSDGISWSSSCSGDGTILFGSSDQPMDQHDPGVLFSADTGKISAPGQRTTWTRNIDYHNTYTFTGSPSQTCNLTAQPHRQYDPGAPGFDQAVETTNPDIGTTYSRQF